MTVTPADNRPWRVRLICCGRDDGEVFRDTWEQADEARRQYVAGFPSVMPGQAVHDRAAIVGRVEEASNGVR